MNISYKITTFYDKISDRYFESTIASVLRAETELNKIYLSRKSVSINDFYELLHIPHVSFGDIVGWHINETNEDIFYELISFRNYMVALYDGMQCCIIEPITLPKMFSQ